MATNPRPADPKTRGKAAERSPAPSAAGGGVAHPAPGVAHRLNLSVQYACNHEALPSRPKVRRWVRASCEHAAQVTVRFVDADEGRALNKSFRGKDYPTNVLSFPYALAPVVSGDLAVCLPVVLREAAAQGKTADAHFAHLIVHGMLHLQGYEHESGASDAARMEAKEHEILARLGYPDPY